MYHRVSVMVAEDTTRGHNSRTVRDPLPPTSDKPQAALLDQLQPQGIRGELSHLRSYQPDMHTQIETKRRLGAKAAGLLRQNL